MTTTLPLDGIRVIDASRVLAGPFATMLLADLGADVIKVEPPDGDETPRLGSAVVGRSRRIGAAPTSRRSTATSGASCSTCGPMPAAPASSACSPRRDLLVHNYRPATAARLGLETDALRARHPRLVVASVGGFPGADADRPAYDLLAQAVSGLMSVTGDAGRPADEGRRRAARPHRRARVRGRGARRRWWARPRTGSVQVSLVEAGVTSLINVLGSHLATGEEPGRHGNAHPNIVPYQAFAAADGDLVVAVGNDAQFRRLLDVLGMTDDGRYATNPQRLARARRARRRAGRGNRSPAIGTSCSRRSRPRTSRPVRSTA